MNWHEVTQILCLLKINNCEYGPLSSMDVLGPKTSRTRPSKTKIRRGPGGEAIQVRVSSVSDL